MPACGKTAAEGDDLVEPAVLIENITRVLNEKFASRPADQRDRCIANVTLDVRFSNFKNNTANVEKASYRIFGRAQ